MGSEGRELVSYLKRHHLVKMDKVLGGIGNGRGRLKLTLEKSDEGQRGQ